MWKRNSNGAVCRYVSSVSRLILDYKIREALHRSGPGCAQGIMGRVVQWPLHSGSKDHSLCIEELHSPACPARRISMLFKISAPGRGLGRGLIVLGELPINRDREAALAGPGSWRHSKAPTRWSQYVVTAETVRSILGDLMQQILNCVPDRNIWP
ncbi:Hypothetical predicted protein [Pelobates cultripes]|uniref:Uncharacterized protein n=1 Tax=Pelobates cultripes TaxID=61616 RepID=A0AAD1TC12_PELCU|nr:Hypothetical predicted protein [Pelobates cultripes]